MPGPGPAAAMHPPAKPPPPALPRQDAPQQQAAAPAIAHWNPAAGLYGQPPPRGWQPVACAAAPPPPTGPPTHGWQWIPPAGYTPAAPLPQPPAGYQWAAGPDPWSGMTEGPAPALVKTQPPPWKQHGSGGRERRQGGGGGAQRRQKSHAVAPPASRAGAQHRTASGRDDVGEPWDCAACGWNGNWGDRLACRNEDCNARAPEWVFAQADEIHQANMRAASGNYSPSGRCLLTQCEAGAVLASKEKPSGAAARQRSRRDRHTDIRGAAAGTSLRYNGAHPPEGGACPAVDPESREGLRRQLQLAEVTLEGLRGLLGSDSPGFAEAQAKVAAIQKKLEDSIDPVEAYRQAEAESGQLEGQVAKDKVALEATQTKLDDTKVQLKVQPEYLHAEVPLVFTGLAGSDGSVRHPTVKPARRAGWGAIQATDDGKPCWGFFGTCPDRCPTSYRAEAWALGRILSRAVFPLTVVLDNLSVARHYARWESLLLRQSTPPGG